MFHRDGDEIVTNLSRSMTRDQPCEENIMKNYVECVDAAIDRRTGAARDTALDETVIRDAKGGIAQLRCMIITVKKSRRGSIHGLPGRLQDVRRQEESPRMTRKPFPRLQAIKINDRSSQIVYERRPARTGL